MAVNVQEVVAAAEAAVSDFGEHRFYDRGAGESMDLQAIVRHLDAEDADAVKDLLVGLVRSGRPGQHAAAGLVPLLDSRDDFDDIYAPELEGLY